MRVALLSLVVCAAACGGGKHGESICDNQVPPPAACMTACDPQPGAQNTCPAGYHCSPDGMCDAECTPNGGQCGDGYICTTDGQCQGSGACTGLQCNVVQCESMGMPATTVSGTVYAPNGTLPLYGVTVYVPNSDPGPLPDGAQCSKCSDTLPGQPVVMTTTDESGKFTLTDVPSGANIPLVIVSGKWRRQITIPNVAQCTDNALQAADTRLPKNKSEGDIPKIAITTGGADALECLLPKLGIDIAEFTNDSGTGRINLFTDSGAGTGGQGASKIQGGGNMSDATTLWSDVNKLKNYDIVIFSCEGAQFPDTKSQDDMNAVKAYADLGGRIFMSHWHNIWIEGATQGGNGQAPMVWPTIATWSNGGNTPQPVTDFIDETNNPKGASFATWMLNVMGSTTRDQITVNDGRTTVSAVDTTKAERWTYWNDNNNNQLPQNFQFTTPNEVAADQRCGKVAFSDMHVSGDSTSDPGTAFPGGCKNTPLTPQEKALAFMIFDLSSCVGSIF
jgi:hypothetical protein